MQWTDCEFVGRDFRDDYLSRLQTERVLFAECDFSGVDLAGPRTTGTRMDDADLRGATVDPSLWTTASLTRARIDIEQALAYAAAHGLRFDSASDQ